MDRQRGDRFGDGGGRRVASRWSSDSPTHQSHRYPRGGGGSAGDEGFSSGSGGGGGGGEGGGGGAGGGPGRYHPYRGPQEFHPPSAGAGFRGSGPGEFEPQMEMGGPRRGFSGRGGSPPDRGNRFAKLFIGSVPRTATEEEVRPLFEEHGNVIEVAFIKDRKTGEQQGCCFVKYSTTEEADSAIRALHNQYTLPGGPGPIQVRYADGEREHHGTVEDKLFVASLNKQATAKEIEEVFSPYGRVEDVYIMRDSSRQSRGCGFVKFANREMAAAALKALNGVYVMRGCDQPLVVRFADPKRPRLAESRGGPAFGGPGFSPRSDAALVIRPTANLEDPRNGQMPPDSWRPMTQESLPPSQAGPFVPTGGPSNGSSTAFNPAIGALRPVASQQISPLQKPLIPPQSFLPPGSNSQTLSFQAPMQQLGQVQVPQSGAPFNQTLPSQQLPGVGGQPSSSQPLIQQNVPSAALPTSLSLQQQAMPAIAQPQFPASTAQQLLQQPIQQFPSQVPQMLLQQQAQALQSSFQSSQQAILQLQQQLQLMQQQQHVSQAVKSEPSWTGPPPTSSTPAGTPSNAPASVMPSAISAAPSLPVSTAAAVHLTCNWTEHNSPEGFKYYYNSITRESRWEKPEEFALFEQHQHQQKMVLLQQQQQPQQQQQKHALQQLPSQPDTKSHAAVQAAQPVSQTQQVQSQIMRQQAQLQLLQPSMMYQTSGGAPQQSMQDSNYTQLQAAGSVVDPARAQQGIQAKQEWAWKNKSAGT